MEPKKKKNMIHKIVAATTLTACVFTSSFSLTEQVLAMEQATNTSTVDSTDGQDMSIVGTDEENTEEDVEQAPQQEIEISPEEFEALEEALLPLTDKELKGIVNNQRIDPKMVFVAQHILAERQAAADKKQSDASIPGAAHASAADASAEVPMGGDATDDVVPSEPSNQELPNEANPVTPPVENPEAVQPTVPTQPEVTPQPPVPTTPAPPIISEETIPSVGGPVKQWKGVPKDSKRYLLKKSAESMLGWRYSQPSRMRPGYRDCSSFVHTAIAKAGFCPEPAWAWTTYTMPYFTDVVYRIPMNELRPGDIVLGDGHVAFYWGTDAMGYPQTLECCWGYGVTYGYMMSNGWNFPYTQAYRVRGIDTKANGEAIDFSNYQPPNIPAYPPSDPYTQDVVHTNGMYGNHYNSQENTAGGTSTGTVASTPQTEGTDLSKGAIYHDPNAIVMTPNKLDGKIIDIEDIDKNPVRAIDLYLSKDLNEFETQELQQLTTDEEKLAYLIKKVGFYREDTMAAFLAKYLDIDYKAKKDYDLDALVKSVKDSFVVADQPADAQLLLQKLMLHEEKTVNAQE